MEITLRFDEILELNTALGALLDRKSPSPEFAVRVAQAAVAVEPVAQSIFEQRNRLLEETAERDADGNPVYEDEEKTRYRVTPQMRTKVQDLLDGTTSLHLPALTLAGFTQDSEGFPLSVYIAVQPVLREDFTVQTFSLKRSQVIDAARTINDMATCNFVDPRVSVTLAEIRKRLLEQARIDDKLRMGLAVQYAKRDKSGNIVYVDNTESDFEVDNDGVVQLQKFHEDTVEIKLPLLRAEDLHLRDGMSPSSRRLLGLLPLIVLDD